MADSHSEVADPDPPDDDEFTCASCARTVPLLGHSESPWRLQTVDGWLSFCGTDCFVLWTDP